MLKNGEIYIDKEDILFLRKKKNNTIGSTNGSTNGSTKLAKKGLELPSPNT